MPNLVAKNALKNSMKKVISDIILLNVTSKEQSCKICGKQFPNHWHLKGLIEKIHGTKISW